MYYLFILFILIVTAGLPWWLPIGARRYPGLKLQAAPKWLPVLAGLLFVVAGWLPDIHISHETNTFQEHFVGGGLYCALLFVYLKHAFGWRARLLVSLGALFAFASALGVANELFEFTLVKTGITHIDITDTSWDLVANTLGALFGYIILCLVELYKNRFPPSRE